VKMVNKIKKMWRSNLFKVITIFLIMIILGTFIFIFFSSGKGGIKPFVGENQSKDYFLTNNVFYTDGSTNQTIFGVTNQTYYIDRTQTDVIYQVTNNTIYINNETQVTLYQVMDNKYYVNNETQFNELSIKIGEDRSTLNIILDNIAELFGFKTSTEKELDRLITKSLEQESIINQLLNDISSLLGRVIVLENRLNATTPANVTNITPPQEGVFNKIKLMFPIYEPLDDFKATTLATNYDLVILNSINQNKISLMKQVNPNIKILEYKTSFLCDGSDALDTTIEGIEFINTSHFEYFATENGKLIMDPAAVRLLGDGTQTHLCYLMNPKSGWRDYSATQFLTEVKTDGFDGLFMDVVTVQPYGNYLNKIDQFTSITDWQMETTSYLNLVGSKFASENKIFIINAVEYVTMGDTYLNYAGQGKNAAEELFKSTSGGMDEIFMMGKWTNGVVYYRDTQDYDNGLRTDGTPKRTSERSLSAHNFASKNNKYFLAYSQVEGCLVSDLDYSIGSFMLGIGDKSYLNPACNAHHTYDISVTTYNAVKDKLNINCGKAKGEMIQNGDVFTRDFEKCSVKVDIGTHIGQIIPK